MEVNDVKCKSILSKSKLYGVDYSINPYTGCGHSCRYCYAVFMRRFTDHDEKWGKFVDVKVNAADKLREDLMKAEPGSVLLSSVTDAYQPLERKYELTREILEVLSGTEFPVTILTKSGLVLRDLDILKKFDHGNLSVGFTLNFLGERDREAWEPGAPPLDDRVKALKKLSSEGIPAYVHVGPYFEGITDLEGILERTEDYITEMQIENLNWRRKEEIMETVRKNYPELEERYEKISRNGSCTKKLKEDVERLRGKDVPVRLFMD